MSIRSKIFYTYICSILCGLALAIGGLTPLPTHAISALGQMTGKSKDNPFEVKKDQPINIKANNLAILNKKDYAVFKNNVHVTQGDVQIWADEMHIYSYYNKRLKKKEIKRIECYGNVKFKGKNQSSKSGEAVYHVNKGLLELTKNVFLQEGGNTIEGQKFIYEVETGRTSISNNANSKAKKASSNKTDKSTVTKGNRVKANLIPGEDITSIEMPSPSDNLKKKIAKNKRKAKKEAEKKAEEAKFE